jgi:hypothetical protein
MELKVREHLIQTLPSRSDHGRVEGTANRKESGLDAFVPKMLDRLLHALPRAGDDRLPGGIDVSNPDTFH